MDTEVDLTTVDRDVLIAIIAELQAVIERLQRRVAELEGQAKPGGPLRMPGLKAKSARKPPAQQEPRKQRRHGFARPRMTPTHRVEHVMENCPDCGAHLSGGWIQRTREVIELPVVPAQVTEHVYIARTCPACRRRCTPPAELGGVSWVSSAPPPRGSIPAGAATTSQFTSSTTSAGARSDTSDPALVKMSLRAFSARITQREDWKSCQHRGNGTRAARLYRPDACPCDQQGGF